MLYLISDSAPFMTIILLLSHDIVNDNAATSWLKVKIGPLLQNHIKAVAGFSAPVKKGESLSKDGLCHFSVTLSIIGLGLPPFLTGAEKPATALM